MSEARNGSGRGIAGIAAIACAFALSACVGGTTYGTGVSQEEQTFKDLYNMFTLNNERKNIDYSPRPDLIVPENTAALPEPLDSEATTSNPDWPETPEQRIARVRAEAGEVDPRTGDYSIREQLREKEGIEIERSSSRGEFVPGLTDRDGNPVLYRGNDKTRKKVLKAKADVDYSRGTTRKYLTEPPVEYRMPAETAPDGQEAFSEEELAAREEQKKKLRKEEFESLTSRD